VSSVKPPMHTPVDVTARAVASAGELAADCVVAIRRRLVRRAGQGHCPPHPTCRRSLLPTTYAGSEATSILGQTADGEKAHLAQSESPAGSDHLRRRSDVDAVRRTRPPSQAMNAIAHAVEALYAQDGNPVTSILAEEAIRRFCESVAEAGRVAFGPRGEIGRALLRRLALRDLP